MSDEQELADLVTRRVVLEAIARAGVLSCYSEAVTALLMQREPRAERTEDGCVL